MAFGLSVWFLIVSVSAQDTVEMVQTKVSGGQIPQGRSDGMENATQRLIHEVVDAAVERIREGADRRIVAEEAAHASADAVKQISVLEGELADSVVDDEIAAAQEVVSELYADQAPAYVLGAFRSNTCPSGSTSITNPNKCEQVVAILGYTWGNPAYPGFGPVGTWGTSPNGCLVDNRGYAFFNHHAGTGHQGQQKICFKQANCPFPHLATNCRAGTNCNWQYCCPTAWSNSAYGANGNKCGTGVISDRTAEGWGNPTAACTAAGGRVEGASPAWQCVKQR